MYDVTVVPTESKTRWTKGEKCDEANDDDDDDRRWSIHTKTCKR
jgi:hypothetical protein